MGYQFIMEFLFKVMKKTWLLPPDLTEAKKTCQERTENKQSAIRETDVNTGSAFTQAKLLLPTEHCVIFQLTTAYVLSICFKVILTHFLNIMAKAIKNQFFPLR